MCLHSILARSGKYFWARIPNNLEIWNCVFYISVRDSAPDWIRYRSWKLWSFHLKVSMLNFLTQVERTNISFEKECKSESKIKFVNSIPMSFSPLQRETLTIYWHTNVCICKMQERITKAPNLHCTHANTKSLLFSNKFLDPKSKL